MDKHIIACIDASNYAQSVAEAAGWLGKSLSAPVTLLHAIEAREKLSSDDSDIGQHLSNIDNQQNELAKQRGDALLSIAHDQIEESFGLAPHKQLVENGLLNQLEDMDDKTRVVVVGRRGENTAGDIGSHIEQIIKFNSHPILVVDQQFTAPKTALIAFDGSESMVRAIHTLAESPLFKNIHCHVVLVGAETDEHKEQLKWAHSTLEYAEIEVTSRLLLESDVDTALVNYAQEQSIDCMIMGAYSHSKLRQFLVGSKTEAILQRSHGTLLILS